MEGELKDGEGEKDVFVLASDLEDRYGPLIIEPGSEDVMSNPQEYVDAIKKVDKNDPAQDQREIDNGWMEIPKKNPIQFKQQDVLLWFSQPKQNEQLLGGLSNKNVIRGIAAEEFANNELNKEGAQRKKDTWAQMLKLKKNNDDDVQPGAMIIKKSIPVVGVVHQEAGEEGLQQRPKGMLFCSFVFETKR
ncbi:hypothetical protein RFI_04225 [Reticulomyxa filosa]|uniref:Uncharacterized protein n=1 Tax=Reticulomyxa filosa TaxID=46433 RepID=X6P2Y5_RETFI|nr:hypothetical protein RFI_04225 [Reticulomyxa filosa]|eukprot:ETO32890.1 hypothetical protein RFI_04225 [Reticulomyxa filosa]